ncbi:MAG TPA: hypothetical protein VGM62_01445 [Chthoniobacterales bacterium]
MAPSVAEAAPPPTFVAPLPPTFVTELPPAITAVLPPTVVTVAPTNVTTVVASVVAVADSGRTLLLLLGAIGALVLMRETILRRCAAIPR